MSEERGRPTVMTPEVISKIEEAFLLGCTDLEACLVANISKHSLYRYQEANPDFLDRKEQLKKTPTLKARMTVVKDIETNSDLAMKYLERKEKDEFSTKNETNNAHTFTQMGTVTIQDESGKKELSFNVGEP